MSENKKETNPAQPFIDSSLKALYAAAGLTDLLTERFREYAEAKHEEARLRREKAREQFAQATEKAQEMMTTAPQRAQAWPEQVQKQLDDMLKDLNLSYEEMVRRGEARLQELRGHAQSRTADGPGAEQAADDTAEPVSEADEDVVASAEAATETDATDETDTDTK